MLFKDLGGSAAVDGSDDGASRTGEVSARGVEPGPTLSVPRVGVVVVVVVVVLLFVAAVVVVLLL